MSQVTLSDFGGSIEKMIDFDHIREFDAPGCVVVAIHVLVKAFLATDSF